MLGLIRESRRFFLSVTLAGLALRLLFFFYYPAVTDDSRIYADLATNWLHHGIYGQTLGGQTRAGAQGNQILPVDTRLPGYPAFLALIFGVFGPGNFKAVMLAQILVDLGTCFIVADFARRAVSARASRIAFVLAAFCPFLANYCAAVLTETLELFFTALALDCAAAALNRMDERNDEPMEALPIAGKQRLDKQVSDTQKSSGRLLWAGTGLAIAACILLRPDGGILLAAVLLYLAFLYLILLHPKLVIWKRCPGKADPPEVAVAGIVLLVFALAPLAPWTLRNLHTLHHFQPLVPRYANDRDEFVPRGFNRWIKTWMADYVSVEEIYWNVPGDKIDAAKLPARAFDNAAQRDATLALIADYNEDQDMTPELDARFGELAAESIHAHPLRYYVALPLLRIADMWLRPRTELLPCDPRWWEFNDEPKMSAIAVGFGLLNLAYVAAALAAAALATLFSRHSTIRWLGLLVIFLLLRSAFLGTLENPEPRYTLECYPVIIVIAAAGLTRSCKVNGCQQRQSALEDGLQCRGTSSGRTHCTMRRLAILTAYTLSLGLTSCGKPSEEILTEVKNGPFKVDVRSQEFHRSGIRNIDICVADVASGQFPTDSGQCFLHGFDFSGLSVKWVSERNVEISFACGRVSRFSNFAVISKGRPLPVEFHATLNDGCNATQNRSAVPQ